MSAELKAIHDGLAPVEEYLQALLRRVTSLRAMSACPTCAPYPKTLRAVRQHKRNGQLPPTAGVLDDRRLRLGLSQAALARAASMSRQGITEILRGARNAPETRWHIHEVLLALEAEKGWVLKGMTA